MDEMLEALKEMVKDAVDLCKDADLLDLIYKLLACSRCNK